MPCVNNKVVKRGVSRGVFKPFETPFLVSKKETFYKEIDKGDPQRKPLKN